MKGRRVAIMLAMLLAIAACDGAGAEDTSPVGLLDLTEGDLAAIESHFAPIEAEEDAFDELQARGDFGSEAVRSFVEEVYSPAIVFHDETFGDHSEGYDEVLSMYQLFLAYFRDAVVEDEPTLIGDTTALQVIPFWNMTLGLWEFTENEPLIEVDLIEIDGDRIGSLMLFYDLSSLRRMSGDASDLAGSLQTRYPDAWMSGSTSDVVALYVDDAVRHDGLARIDITGSQAIASEAERWFAAIPDATWELRLPFGETSGRQAGAVFGVTHEDCTVTLGILWDIDERELITRERLHYDPATLRTCGWAG